MYFDYFEVAWVVVSGVITPNMAYEYSYPTYNSLITTLNPNP